MEFLEPLLTFLSEKWLWLCIVPFLFLLSAYSDWRSIGFLEKSENKYFTFIKGMGPQATEKEKQLGRAAADWLREAPTQLIKLYDGANVTQPKITQVVPKGLNHVETQYIYILNNLTFPNPEIAERFSTSLANVKGYYRYNAKKKVNPIYWLEVLVFLPKFIPEIFKLKDTPNWLGHTVNVIQLFYWVGLLATYILQTS